MKKENVEKAVRWVLELNWFPTEGVIGFIPSQLGERQAGKKPAFETVSGFMVSFYDSMDGYLNDAFWYKEAVRGCEHLAEAFNLRFFALFNVTNQGTDGSPLPLTVYAGCRAEVENFIEYLKGLPK